MSTEGPSIAFYVRGIVALAVLFGLTMMMPPTAEVSYLRAMIGVGFAIVVVKIVLRRCRPHWLPAKFGGSRQR